MRRLIDLSVPVMAGIASDPPGLLPEIDYYTHEQSAEDVVSYFPGATVDDLPDREGWAIERVRMATHSGTHLDAPYHYSTVMDLAITDGGTRAITIDEVPLEREATLYMLERGVRLTGTDAWSWDAPFVHTARRFAVEHDASVIWEGHRAGRDIGYCHLEKLHALESLPATGFEISCFPVKVHAASAGWTRASRDPRRLNCGTRDRCRTHARRPHGTAGGLAPCRRMDLNHLNLGVRDAAACRDFYQRHFGFRPAFEADGGYFVRNDEGFLLALIPADCTSRCPTASTSASAWPTPAAVADAARRAGRGRRARQRRSRTTGPARRTSRSGAGIPTAPRSRCSGTAPRPTTKRTEAPFQSSERGLSALRAGSVRRAARR